MKISCGLAAIITTITLYNLPAYSLPTKKYKTHMDLLKKEKKLLKKEAAYYSVVPLPIPLVSNSVSGSIAWNKYYKCNKMYLYFKSARIIVSSENNPDKFKKSELKKADERLKKLLKKTRKESREAAEKKTGLIGRSESQKSLDERIEKMTVSEVAHLLIRADKVIPPSCGNPYSGVPEIRGYNLRYQIRTASLYHPGKSNLEQEIEAEEQKLIQKGGYEDQQQTDATSLSGSD